MKLKMIAILVLVLLLSGCNTNKKGNTSEGDTLSTISRENVNVKKNVHKSTVELMGLKGAVKSIKETSLRINHLKSSNLEKSYSYNYRFNESGNLIEQQNFNSDGNFEKLFIYEYNENGYLIEEKVHNKDSVITSKLLYKYDDYGYLLEEKTLSVYQDTLRIIKYKYQFPDIYKSKIVSEFKDEELFRESFFNLWGNLERIEENDGYGSKRVSNYSYDDNGRVTVAGYDSWKKKVLFKYNDYGDTTYYETLIYDEVKSSYWSPVTESSSFSYIYDEENNWIEQKQFIGLSENLDADAIIKREIEYY